MVAMGAFIMDTWAWIRNRAEKSRARRNEPQSADADAAPTLAGDVRFAEVSKGATGRAGDVVRINKTNARHRASGRKALALAGRPHSRATRIRCLSQATAAFSKR